MRDPLTATSRSPQTSVAERNRGPLDPTETVAFASARAGRGLYQSLGFRYRDMEKEDSVL